VLAVSVEQAKLSQDEREQLEGNLAEARAAGVRVDLLEGDDIVEAIVQYARSHGVTQIFVGHSMKKDWKTRLWGSPVSRLIRAAAGIDVRVFPH
jgi:two-component system sensor histidine kinase KdpD